MEHNKLRPSNKLALLAFIIFLFTVSAVIANS